MKDYTNSGITGCGGAGFPAHIKLASKGVETLIVNAAECEPLLHKDKLLLLNETEAFFKGLSIAQKQTGAAVVKIGIKAKYPELIKKVEASIAAPNVSVLPLGDFYPAGDEYELVYEATGKLIPFGGIPINVGCVVMNVETLVLIGSEKPFTHKWLTITGEVPSPVTVKVPVGAAIPEVMSLAGFNGSFSGKTLIDGGPMMGKVVAEPEKAIVKKTTGGLILLDNEHPLIKKMLRSEQKNTAIARSACDQCTDCTEICPRALLGYPVKPHKAMRSAQFSKLENSEYTKESIFCSECGLCSNYSCPESLTPREMCMKAKKLHLSNGVKQKDFLGEPHVHHMRWARRVTIERLIKRLALIDYDRDAPVIKTNKRFERVVLPLRMHIGAPASPVVQPNQQVQEGDLIAAIPEGKLAAALHASISGRIESVTNEAIVISRG
ncbi:MAG: electron transport complex protein RnfC [Candidatus Riflebacteria bacterium]|nr:electron transport complex protein RnfC [Candidatus Riflebacteria bacterium]